MAMTERQIELARHALGLRRLMLIQHLKTDSRKFTNGLVISDHPTHL